MTRPNDSVEIGLITAAHGIRGQLKLRSLAIPPEGIFEIDIMDAKGNRVFLKHDGGNARGFIVSLKGVADRNAAELLKGTRFYTTTENLPESAPQRLNNLPARLQNGEAYGTVLGTYNFGAGDIVEIRKTNGEMEMLPLQKGFAEVKKTYVLVTPPEYVEGK